MTKSATLPIDHAPVTKDVALMPVVADGTDPIVTALLQHADRIDVDKLSKIIDLQERILNRNAETAFNAAFARMQAEIPEVIEKGQILVKGTLRSTYAKLEDIYAVIKPILKAHGFALRHRTEWPDDRNGVIRIVGILSHIEGHHEESVFEAPADKSDYRTDIQSMGSTVSYGRRYTTLDLLNIVTRGADDDGKKSGRPQPPDGYDDWWGDMIAVADEGIAALEKAWGGTKNNDFKAYTLNANKDAWRQLKEKAQKVKA